MEEQEPQSTEAAVQNPTKVSGVPSPDVPVTHHAELLLPAPVSSKKKGSLRFLVFGFGMMLIFGLGFFIALSLVQTKPSVVPVMPTPSPEISPKPVLNNQHQYLYIKEGNVFVYNQSSKEEAQITTDASDLIRYQSPQWYFGANIVYIRCEHEDVEGKLPYHCSLITQSLNGENKVEQIKLGSSANDNGFQTGGDFQSYAISSAGIELAYLTYEVNEETKISGKDLRLSIKIIGPQNSPTLLDEFTMPPGRGGSLRDDVSLHFSPDDAKLLFNNTLIYNTPGNVRGSLFVYNLQEKKLLQGYSDFLSQGGQWFNEEQFLAIQPLFDTDQLKLMKIGAVSGTSVPITDAQDWLHPEVLKNRVIFWSLNPEPGKGVFLEAFNLESKERQVLQENLLKLKVLSDGLIVVERMQPCAQKSEGCAMDIYNGYTPAGFALFNSEDGTLTDLLLPESISEIDVQ